MRTTQRLYEAAHPIWEQCHDHPFVRGIGDGSLDLEKFQWFLLQDYLYLFDYAKVFAQGVVKAREPDAMRAFASYVDSILNGEMDIHKGYMARLGIRRSGGHGFLSGCGVPAEQPCGRAVHLCAVLPRFDRGRRGGFGNGAGGFGAHGRAWPAGGFAAVIEILKQIVAHTREVRPLIHTITNNVTVNDCANIILAAYGAPTMAQDEREVEEITALSQALVLNLGALRAQEAMLLAGKKANALGHPVVMDPVAAGASFLRGETSRRLLHEVQMAVIRGNASEIRALAVGSETTQGVEVNAIDKVTEENLDSAVSMVRAFSRRTGAAVVLTGEIDLISDGRRTAVVRGGCEMMSRITGAGCMLTALTAAYCGANPERIFESAVAAAGVMDVCGELAYRRVREAMEGTASFRTRLIDAVSLLTDDALDALNVQIL